MIDRSHKFPVLHQCLLLGLARSTAYYAAREVSPEDLALMRRIDELHLEHPFAGTRMLRDLLRPEGFRVGRKHIGTLMDCAEICAASHSFLHRGSPHHAAICAACATVCDACAACCAELGLEDAPTKTCAAACKACADSCRKMAKH